MDKYLITGATGLIGSALVKKIYSIGGIITCPVRSIEKASTLFNKEIFSSIDWIEGPLEAFITNMKDSYDYIIHCASPTASKYFVENPVETLKFNIETTFSLLNHVKECKVKGIVFLSSLESYGTITDDIVLDENYQGYVNPMETRSSYNMAKRTCESICHAYAEEYNVPVKVVRLTQTISPFIYSNDQRVFAQFARHAANNEDIELHTEGNSARQYVFIDDAVEAILRVLFKGNAGEAYNVANEETYISVKEMALFVQKNFNPLHNVVIKKKSNMGYAPFTKIKLNTNKIKSLGWLPKYNLFDMYNVLINQLIVEKNKDKEIIKI